MSDDLDEIDAALRRAMAALDGDAPAGYFDALPGRTLARLDDPALGELPEPPGRQRRREPASEPPVRPLRAVQAPRPPSDDDDDAVFSSQVMAAVDLPEAEELAEPAAPSSPWRDDRAAPSSVVAVLPARPRSEPAGDAVVSAGAVAAPASTASAGPVEAPAGAAVSMTSAGSARHRRSRRIRAAIVGTGAIGLAAVAVIYLAGGDRARRSAPSVVLSSERAASGTTAEVASPGAGRGASVSSVAAGSAASTGPGAGTNSGSRPTASGGVAGSAATPPAGSGSGAPQDRGSGAVDRPVAKVPGPPGKRPGNVKSPSKGGGDDVEIELPGFAGQGAAGKKIKSSKPRPDRTPLSSDDIARAMTAVAGQVRACVAGAGAAASLRLTVAPSGRIAQVAVTGPLAGTPAAACLARAVQAATFPAWSGAPQSFDYSYPRSD
jgi:hypothetical protein